MQHIFSNNYQLCSEISETVLHHFIHCLATHGRHIQYLNFLHTIIKAEGKYVKKCQDMIMTEVCQCDFEFIKLIFFLYFLIVKFGATRQKMTYLLSIFV